MGVQKAHYAILGMACVQEGYPLYFDGFNEKGLAMAGLNFVGNAHYKEPMPDRENVASFEFIPWILSQCASVQEAKQRIERINLTNIPFSDQLPPAGLHWILADRNEAITVESVEEGIRVYPNPVGVLTNEPPFDEQLFQLNNYMHLSSRQPRNLFSEKLDLRPYSRGMGALGLPGDLSSQSRFVRAAFVKMNSVSGKSEAESVSQFFHILGSVDQVRGCCEVEPGKFEITMYASCCNTDKGIYYYTTYSNRRISAVNMQRESLDGNVLVCYPLIRGEQIFMQN
jgi:choloylglycine hydrolase